MSAQSQDNAINSGKLTRALIYTALLLFAFYYLLPLYVMLVNSFKPLEEIRRGGMLNLPQQWTIEPWLSAWSTAQIGVQPTGLKPFFINSILMVVPAVAISTIVGALNGYVLTKWQFRGSNIFFRLIAVVVLHSVPDRTHSDGACSWFSGDRGHDLGTDPRACGLRYRFHDALFPQLL